MTADKVTLRLNAVVTYKIVDARKAFSQSDDVRQALYRETQLVLRSVVGARELDAFLTEKDAVATEIEENVRRRAGGPRGCPGSGERFGRYPGCDPAGRPAGPDCLRRLNCNWRSHCIEHLHRWSPATKST